jgi:NADH-quinone oxidoreductase subunit G
VTSELSGNVNDLCPVGALTHKPWTFNYRPWELKKTQSIDVMDALGSAIRVDSRGAQVMRALPRVNEDINEEWLSDKSRYAVDGLGRQRLDRPYVRVNGKLAPATWGEAFAAVAGKIRATSPEKIGVIAGDLQDAESMKAALDLFGSLGVRNLDCRQDGTALGAGPRESWLFNTTLAGIEQADVVLLVGTNPRTRGPGVQRPPAQAVAQRQDPLRRDRRAGRPDLRLRLPRRRPGLDQRPGQGQVRLRQGVEGRQEPGDHHRPGRPRPALTAARC